MTLFGYTILIAKRKKRNTKGSIGRFVDNACIITKQDGYLVLSTPDGHIIPKQCDMTIESPMNGPVTATVTFLIGGIKEGT